MKSLKYNLIVILSFLVLACPVVSVIISMYFYWKYKVWWIFLIGALTTVISIALVSKMRDLRVKYRREVEYDEYGMSKSKGRYEYLSKKERDMMDLQKTADMERLVNTTAIKKMIKKGPKDPMKELDEMIGLESVKESVKEMAARMKFEAEENKKKKKGSLAALSGRHFCFTGNPGTGKTTVARIITGFLYQYGYIKENKCLEIDGNSLKAGTDSAIKTELILRHAYGGVLFIDEAYALMDSSDNSGEQVIATLIKQMEDNRDKFILIIAGYTNEMKRLIDANPGFESRIKEYLHFPDYTDQEMREILSYMAKQRNFEVNPESFEMFDSIVERERRLKSFGNARTVRNILDKAIDKHALNLSTGKVQPENRYQLMPLDFHNLKLGGLNFNMEY